MMTKEQIALDTLKRIAGNTKQSKQCRSILLPLVLRDKSKKYEIINGQCACPNCKKLIINVWSTATYMPRYCHYCGQALDWGKDNEER